MERRKHISEQDDIRNGSVLKVLSDGNIFAISVIVNFLLPT